MKSEVKKQTIIKISGVILVCLLFIGFICNLHLNQEKEIIQNAKYDLPMSLNDYEEDYVFLSDMNYISSNNWSYVGWGSLRKDANPEGGKIKLIVNDEERTFIKGIGAHAKAQLTYDISTISTKYPRFTATIGVDASRTIEGKVWFEFFVSNDGEEWTSLLKTSNITYKQNALSVDINVEGYKYFRIYIDPSGDNSADHSVLGNAKFIKKNYEEVPYQKYDKVKTLEYYDEILNEKDTLYNYQNNYRYVLEREFVRKIGYTNIQDLSNISKRAKATLDWILSSNEVLEQVIEVGEIANGSSFIDVLSNLYCTYQDDLKEENGYVYQKMMIALAAAYTTDRIISPLAFSFQTPTYDYVERFAIMKRLFDNNQFRRVKINALQGELVQNDWFKDYHVELMRMVMQDGTSNGDLIWLNGFTNEKQSVSFYMIGYVSPVYTQDKYYIEENRETYDKQFYLSKYGVPYGLVNGIKIPRYWMVFANGGICWNASRTGQSMYRVNGIPGTGAYQVGHELYIQYYEDENGNGYWTPRYGNWSGAGSTWGGGNPYRYIFNWNNKYFTNRHISGSRIASSTGYLYLGQDNLNHYDEYKKSLYYNLIANSYVSNEQKLDSYFESLKINKINLDSYDNIINLYKQMNGTIIDADDWYQLALKVVDSYKYHPVAMFDLLKVIRPYLEGSEKLYIDRLEKDTLTKATTVTSNETIQVDGVRTHARQLLNQTQPDPMTFSFDGENAGKIVKNPIYDLAWSYSIDGGNTFSNFVYEDSITLTSEEIANITSENDIVFKFMGLNDYRFTIDIVEGTLSSLLFANDLENRVIGIDLTYEWRNNESDSWTSYRTSSPNNTGNKTLYVRRGATGVQLASNSVTYTFTDDNQSDKRKYVPVSHLSIQSVSTEAVSNAGSAAYAIDGNYNTRYHSAWNGTDTERYMVIKLDKPRYVSAVEFVPAAGGNGRINDGTIWGSMDGENWEILTRKTGITYSMQANTIEQAKALTQSFEISEENRKEVEYIKIVADRTNGNWFTARAFNIFQDITQNERPTAGIGYSTKNPTKDNVIARLVNISAVSYEIISDGGDTHEFTENGSFTFRFRDTETNLEGSATAVVDWIDRIAPTAEIEYSTTTSTNESVIATLKPSEDVIVTNNGDYKLDEDGNLLDQNGNVLEGYTVDSEGNVKDPNGNQVANINTFTYEFLSNGEFTFEFMDKAGNRGSATAVVDWIDDSDSIGTIHYSTKKPTREDVTVTLNLLEGAKVINNNGNNIYTFTENGTFTFEVINTEGINSKLNVKVSWIDKTAPVAGIKIDKSNPNKAIVSVVNPSEEITFLQGNGTYTFTQNGEYEIYFKDKVGNIGSVKAIIDFIKPVNNNSGNKDTFNNSSSKNNTQKKNNSYIKNNNVNSSNNTNIFVNDKKGDEIMSEYVIVSAKNVVLEIPKRNIVDDLELEVKELTLNEKLLKRFSSNSKYYQICLKNSNDEKVTLELDDYMKLKLSLNKKQKFLGLYEVLADNSVIPVSYELINNEIIIQTKTLGKYIVSYEEEKEISEINEESTKDNTKYPWIAIGASIMILTGTIMVVIKRRK